MAKVRLDPMTWEHARSMTLRSRDVASLSSIDPEKIRGMYLNGPAGALVMEGTGEVLLCAGVVPQWRGLGYAWIVATPMAFVHIKSVLPLIKRMLKMVMAQGFNRLQIYVDASWPAARRFAEHLGFGYDTTFSNYGPNGETYIVMSIFKEGRNESD